MRDVHVVRTTTSNLIFVPFTTSRAIKAALSQRGIGRDHVVNCEEKEEHRERSKVVENEVVVLDTC